MKKIAFVAHEFGLFKGHGGVASYLHLLVSRILEKPDISVYVITVQYDKKSELLNHRNLTIMHIPPVSQHEQGIHVLNHLLKVRPDCVEVIDYLGYVLETLVYRASTPQNALSNTTFITLHHTASRESFVWNDKVSINLAPYHIRECFVREKTQMRLSDLNVAPVRFMKNYVKTNYLLEDVTLIYHPTMLDIREKNDVRKRVAKEFDISFCSDRFVINCISRIEGRKNQKALIQQFLLFLKETKAKALLFLVGNTSVNSVTNREVSYEIYETIPEQHRDKIMLYDFMGTTGKENILAISDVTVMASTFENSPIALNESVCSGVPVIVSKYCGFADYLVGTESQTVFDPFEENALCKRLTSFYSLSDKQRQTIAKTQLKNLVDISSDKNTVDKRLDIYFNTKPKTVAPKRRTLILDCESYLMPVGEETVRAGYDSVMFFFDASRYDKFACLYLLEKTSDYFKDKEVVAYGGENTYLGFIDFFVYDVPFFIKGICIEKDMLGIPLWKAVLPQLDKEAETYCLTGTNTGKALTSVQDYRKEDFKKRFLDYFFMQKNEVLMEELYAE